MGDERPEKDSTTDPIITARIREGIERRLGTFAQGEPHVHDIAYSLDAPDEDTIRVSYALDLGPMPIAGDPKRIEREKREAWIDHELKRSLGSYAPIEGYRVEPNPTDPSKLHGAITSLRETDLDRRRARITAWIEEHSAPKASYTRVVSALRELLGSEGTGIDDIYLRNPTPGHEPDLSDLVLSIKPTGLGTGTSRYEGLPDARSRVIDALETLAENPNGPTIAYTFAPYEPSLEHTFVSVRDLSAPTDRTDDPIEAHRPATIEELERPRYRSAAD